MAFGGLSVEAQLGGEVFGPPASKFTHLGHFPRRFELCVPTNWPTDYHSVQDPFLAPAVVSGHYPDIWMPLEDVMAMYWRVKKWKYNVSVEWSEVNAAQSGLAYVFPERHFSAGQANEFYKDYLGETFIESDAPSGDETSLVCGFPSPEYTVTVFPDFGDPFEELISVDDHFLCAGDATVLAVTGEFAGSAGSYCRHRIEWSFGNTFAAYGRKNPQGRWEYMPTIRFSADTFRWEIFAFPATRPTTLGNRGTFTYKFLGKSYSCPIYANNTRDFLPDFTNTLSINATLEATEYWPYDPGDGGGPIYSAKFGDKLR
jgi:hypothetical protein